MIDQQKDRADDRIDNGCNHADAEVDADLRKQPAGNDGADNADDDVADQAEAVTLHDQAREPSRQ